MLGPDDAQLMHDIAAEASRAVERCVASGELERLYERLREQACQLNRREAWATPEEFATLLPDLSGLRSIDGLEAAVREVRADEQQWRSRLRHALRGLSGWAAGHLAAHELCQLLSESGTDPL